MTQLESSGFASVDGFRNHGALLSNKTQPDKFNLRQQKYSTSKKYVLDDLFL